MPRVLNLTAAMLLAGALALPVSHASAQVRNELPVSVVEAGAIGGSEQTQIDQYVAQLAGPLTGADAEAASRARRDLITPLAGRQPSVAFRQAYAQATGQLMSGLLASDDAGARLAGLRLAGHLGTSEGVNAVRTALGDADPSIQVFAAVQARRVFEVSGAAGPAVTEAQLGQLIDALSAAAKPESSQPFAQAVVRALGAGASIRARELNATRSRSLEALSRVAAQRVRAVGPQNLLADENTVLEATSIATRSVSEAGIAVSDEAAKAAAELGGEILGLTLKRQTQNLIPAQPDADLRLLNAGESLIFFARRRQIENARGNVNSIPQTNLATLLTNRDRNFRNELVRLIGPGSEFLRQFSLPDNRFVN